ncbi:peptidoglycan editing factor PgeF [Achromobacter sp. ES-001]|uniref:peptidoglycan editing factor PgeF n=1 Tax=unclassified Achromobacter TaxID=2626865 RepID=UPI000E70E29D|nr:MULTISPECIES: peptidoglycan editing factor PgeF [unclassified Achromobacter]AYD63628.1 peptidoglycan editing factor PgeF [Achromobacter sp. B7]QYJ23000.1 peptidoglycan editing factor PgeF [Achromobacter sp. ES-001]
MDRVIASLPVVTGPSWPGVSYFCTTRAGGVGVAPHDSLNLGRRAGDNPDTVSENRRRVRAAVPGEPLWLRQVHGSEVVDADAPDLPDEPAVDASVTAQPGRVLAIMVADCLPVVIADGRGQVLGAAHAGWRGLAGGVLEHTLAAMQAKAPDAGGWRAWVGPGIGPTEFEVGQDVLDAFTADDPATLRFFTPRPGLSGKWLADLAGLADFRLRRAGVQEVALSGMCTVSDPQRFFSYRRDTETGRMALLAWLDPV